jgi:NitT/TauT family transport system ATP-binding protein
MGRDPPLLSLLDVHHRFLQTSQSGSGLTVELWPGELLAVVGRSGTGKSTLVRIAVRLLTPESGRVVQGSGDASEFRAGVAFQATHFLPWLTILDNVRLPIVGKSSSGEQRRRASAALERAVLPGAETLYPDQMSGGMRARAALARALVSEPALLILDEPFASLDAALAEDLNDLLVELVDHGLGIILVTQDLDRMLVRADRVLVLGHGPLGSNPVVDLNTLLGRRASGRSPNAVARLRSDIIETMRNPFEEQSDEVR